MSLYTYVPGKAELLDLMLDTVYGQMPRAYEFGLARVLDGLGVLIESRRAG
jgi:hypothetical protein